MLDFYESLLGTEVNTNNISNDAMEYGNKLDISKQLGLLKEVTNEEVKGCLFAIPNSKSPGPDGYSSGFFKKQWGTVGGLITKEVLESDYLGGTMNDNSGPFNPVRLTGHDGKVGKSGYSFRSRNLAKRPVRGLTGWIIRDVLDMLRVIINTPKSLISTGGFSAFIPGLYPQSLPQTSIIRPVIPTNLIGEMDKVGPSRSKRSWSRRSQTKVTSNGDVRSVHSKDEDWDVPQALKKLKGKAVQPEGSRRSAFQRLGHDGRNQNRSAKERLRVETIPASAFNRLERGAGRPGQTRRTEPPPHDEPQNSRAPHGEEEAESHPRHTIRSHVEQPQDRVGWVEARLEKLQRRVDRDEKKKVLLNESPFTDRVHETLFPKKAKLEWFHNLPAGEIDSFDELAEVFQEKFKENYTKKKKFTYLSTAGQREHEDLTKFLTRWKDEVDKVEEIDDKTAMSLLVSSKREAEQGHSKGRVSLKKEIELPARVKTEVMEVKPIKSEKKPAGEKQWTKKYCFFHKSDSHNTAECNSVKGVIKQMIVAGELDPEYVAQANQKKNQWIRLEGQPAEQNKKKKAAGKEHLQVIYGGPEGGESASQRKKDGNSTLARLP
ncbi:unnamed protein product [Cuscuta campestris]|uniref:Retrotransposon gag domain-containing protein n=1 Tax=Cuscuta campestris TaxID=132261 RepID=A0A484M5R0_9ASTE|nr:unnamed protein product [Cuscuta campestris]